MKPKKLNKLEGCCHLLSGPGSEAVAELIADHRELLKRLDEAHCAQLALGLEKHKLEAAISAARDILANAKVADPKDSAH